MTTPKAEEKIGKTFADFLDGLLNQPKKFLYFSLMIFLLGLVIVSIYFLLLRLTKASGLNPSEVQFSALGSVHFETTVNGKKQVLVVVRPQGWQPTGLIVKAGEHLSFEAAGRVSIDFQGLVEAAQEMNKLELDKAEKHADEIKRSKPDGSQKAPEDFFDEDQATKDRYNKLKADFSYLWAEPDGLMDQNGYVTIDKDYPGRTKNKAMPLKPYGALIGAIIPKPNKPSDRENFFLIGKKLESMDTDAAGELWLNINDVIDKADPVDSKIYYFDNIGFFWVKITFED